MKRQEYKIVFEPTGRQVYALPGTILLEAAAQAGLCGSGLIEQDGHVDFLLARIRFVGNVSSMGAKRAFLSVAEKQAASAIARAVRHVDLSLSPEFQAAFSSAMLFPEEDPGKGCEG